MIVKTVEIPTHFYLYCALLFNDNKTVRHSKNTGILKEKVNEILKRNYIEQIPMLDHRYQYLLSVLNSDNYEPIEDTKESHYETLKYVKSLSEIPDLQKLWGKESKELSKCLELYSKPIQDVTDLFATYFNYEPKVNTFSVTRNWDKSGMCIPTKEAFYIVASWNSHEPNVRNIIHEIMHAYVDEVELTISDNIKTVINNLPDEVFKNYRKIYTIVSESLVRALVVYVTNLSTDIQKQEFSEEDLSLQLPEMYLQKLKSDSLQVMSKEYLSQLTI